MSTRPSHDVRLSATIVPLASALILAPLILALTYGLLTGVGLLLEAELVGLPIAVASVLPIPRTVGFFLYRDPREATITGII